MSLPAWIGICRGFIASGTREIPEEHGSEQALDADLHFIGNDVVLGRDDRDAGKPGPLVDETIAKLNHGDNVFLHTEMNQ
ncbi:hypothetical protein ACNJYA_09785 [Bradyrhizobium sp. DASA03068]|uniref:hypothetical protein n=1 Tax=Bradyrhizobium sp. BLXBL-01 TaxID=3395915 RepID=UPI003F708B72